MQVRWSDIDMYQHVNHATMVTILEEARVPFLREPFADDIDDHRAADRRGQDPLQGPTAAGGFAAAGDDLGRTGCVRSTSRSATRCARC